MRECEELLKCVQRSRDSWLDLAGGSRLQAAILKHTCQACQKLKRRASCSLQDKSSRLARPFACGLNSQLNPTARSSRQKTRLERASRENFERKTLEKTRLTHPQSLPKRLFKFLYSLPLYCQILERLFTKTFSHHIHFCERAIWCFGK